MNRLDCQRVRRLVDAALDDELELAARMAFEAHLAGCADCGAIYAARRRVVDGVRGAAERFVAPEALRARVLAGLPADPAEAARPPAGRRWLSAGAWTASATALAASLVLFFAAPGQQDLVARDLLAAHVRSLMPDHLTDVPSSDRHTVKPWFNGRVALSPPVPDLAEDGFPLIGGRLDYVDQHTAAALVYRRSRHLINLFVWAAPGTPDRGPAVESRNGYNILTWSREGVAYAAVSDLARPDLESFQRLWLAKAAEAGPESSR